MQRVVEEFLSNCVVIAIRPRDGVNQFPDPTGDTGCSDLPAVADQGFDLLRAATLQFVLQPETEFGWKFLMRVSQHALHDVQVSNRAGNRPQSSQASVEPTSPLSREKIGEEFETGIRPSRLGSQFMNMFGPLSSLGRQTQHVMVDLTEVIAQ